MAKGGNKGTVHKQTAHTCKHLTGSVYRDSVVVANHAVTHSVSPEPVHLHSSH